MEKQNKHFLIDIHAHILPGVDDGARTIEESCDLIKMAADSGFGAIIATPHYSKRRGTEGYKEVYETLKTEIKKRYPDFEIYLGHETYFHEELHEKVKEGNAFTLAGSRYVLIEFDNGVSFQTIHRAIRRMITSGYLPILAHMERYDCLKDKKNFDNLLGSGCYLQMNYESLEGVWIHHEVRRCRKLVKNGYIHFLGTDMHRVDHRPPEIQKAMDWLLKHVDESLIRKMTYKNAQCVIQNKLIS